MLIRYATAVGLVVLAVGVAVFMDVLLHGPPAAPVFAAVLAAAWLTGFGPAIVAAAIGTMALDRLSVPAHALWQIDVRNALWMLVFLAIVLGVARLVSTVKRREMERSRLLTREQESRTTTEAGSRAKDDFLAMVSHELRNPLSAILGWIHLLKRMPTESPEVARAIDVIERNTVLQAKLIDDLLDVSRAVAGKLDIAMQPIDFGMIVRHAVRSLEPKAAIRAVTVETAIEHDLGMLGDAARLEQVVVNLVSNAITYTPSGGHIHVSADRYGRVVELMVQDTGEGIEEATLPHIFELFHRGPSVALGRREGLGLGLAIVKHIVESHGGSISAHSAGLGHGSTFIVRLPAEVPA